MIKKMSELKKGDVVLAHGARFLVQEDAKRVPATHHHIEGVHWCKGTWLSGRIETGYFGPDKDWSFQGTDAVTYNIEE